MLSLKRSSVLPLLLLRLLLWSSCLLKHTDTHKHHEGSLQNDPNEDELLALGVAERERERRVEQSQIKRLYTRRDRVLKLYIWIYKCFN